MNTATPAGPMANSVFVVAPPHNSYPVIPGAMSKMPLYPNNQLQVHLIPGVVPSVNELGAWKSLKEGKVLGAMQILIGLVHLGLGSIMATVLRGFYVPISFYGGFPFWGGVSFIISGSVSVAAEKRPNSSCLLKASVGLNIFSAIGSAVGIMLFITDLSLTRTYTSPNYFPPYYYWGVSPGLATSGVLLIFCFLEFCVSCTSSHFGCQLTCCRSNNVGMVIPNVSAANPVIIPEPSTAMPTYSNVGQDSK